jgi:mevalonate kinase
VTFAQPVYFVKGRPIETFRVAVPFTIIIGDTGVSSPTKGAVEDVRKAWKAAPAQFEKMFTSVERIVQKARRTIETGEGTALGTLMNKNHSLLQQMTVSSPELDRLVSAARSAGAEGAKLSGGGRGGNMIALVQPEMTEKVSQALYQAGAKRVLITTVS